ncbi:MAG TPA: 16S rRNA (guanine(966)-N(2))-methyltransferase RsmD [Ktedonobacterales bacterium]|jgi:16S rRNA (guanine966-N2)-methyltransferase|nr:16S rRNA (guanine(966)-N(2))-methyltransferase RsmD [Ktedonobacterales bacterium]
MRVISGSARGRKLKSPKSSETRPIMDRVKTALFDILAPEIMDMRVLDLFAGTGAVGIEALSRGAESATFIERSPEAWRLVRENLALTNLSDRAEVLRTDAFAYLQQAAATGRRFDLVYVAPPQYVNMATQALTLLDTTPLTEPDGLVIVQIHPQERAELDALTLKRLRRYDERRYGSTLLLFYTHDEESHATG